MDDEDLEREGAELAELIRVHRRPGLGKRWRCPSELRRRAVVYTEACRDRGESAWTVAQRLGVVESTLCRWLRRERGSIVPVLRPVSVVDEKTPAGEVATSQTGCLRLVTRTGHVVEGLDVQSAAYLLRVLG